MKRIVLLRHGESTWNKENRFTGWTDVDLTEKGIADAHKAGELMKEEGFHFDKAYTSFLKRAVKTLNCVLDKMDLDWIPIEKSWRLNEKHYGSLQGLNKSETASKYGEEQVLIWRRSFDVAPHALEESDSRNPIRETRYKKVPDCDLPRTESLKDTIERILPYWKCIIFPTLTTEDELLVVASERPVIQTSLDLEAEEIHELKPGEGLIMSKDGKFRTEQILTPKNLAACSFERVYFSRGSDKDIYQERKALGRTLVAPILKAVDGELDQTVFSYIPNTAEAAYYGLLEGFDNFLNKQKMEAIAALGANPDIKTVAKILDRRIRSEKIAWKDIKMRTFIAEGNSRNDLAAHVYDITYGSVEAGKDNLVVIDDSIVRGTTLRESIIRILDRLHPKRIVVVSSSPQVRFPDYYGIDMSHMDEFIAFKAAIALTLEQGGETRLKDIYRRCKEQENLPKEQIKNFVKEVYAPFSDDDISKKMAELLRPNGVTTEIHIVYQSLEGLHKACPTSPGDWYFSGDYPTPGGTKRVNQAFIDYYETNFPNKN